MSTSTPEQAEAKRREVLTKLSQRLTDEGKLIEAGWVGYQLAVISPDAPQVQLDETRMAFWAGAQHLFASIMSLLEPGEDPTEADLRRMSLINEELGLYLAEYEKRHGLRGTEH